MSPWQIVQVLSSHQKTAAAWPREDQENYPESPALTADPYIATKENSGLATKFWSDLLLLAIDNWYNTSDKKKNLEQAKKYVFLPPKH